MLTFKSKEDIQKLKQGGFIPASILRELESYTQANYKNDGFDTLAIDKKCDELLAQNGVKASFKNYTYKGVAYPYPANVCVSVNDEVVHGIPGGRILVDGDIVSLDLGVIHDGLYTDAAVSFIIGNGEPEDRMMIEATREALYKGIEQAVVGNTIGDIGHAIESHVIESGFKVVRDYCGHGVGFAVHEDPSIPNYGKKGEGIRLREGMILAIEPMVVMGGVGVFIDRNGWTVKTRDGRRSAHWEHTVAVTEEGPVVLTE